MKKKILIISGDPNSINSEIIIKSWKKIKTSLRKRIYLISNIDLIKKQSKILKIPIQLLKVKNLNEKPEIDKLKIINLGLKFKNPFKIKKIFSSKFILKSLDLAHEMALDDRKVSGIINCAITKELLRRKKIGVTEYLASKCNLKNNSEVMLILNNKLSVSPLTTHINIKDVSKKINKNILIIKVKTIHKWFRKFYKKKPKIGVLGLNPHNAELRKNSEEVRIIAPTISKLKKLGFNIQGPLVSDTIFVNDYKNYDVIIGMYHDQVLSPFKSLFKFDAINVTLGLKYLRVSPDHGTAINLIGKSKANITSFLNCIKFIDKFGK